MAEADDQPWLPSALLAIATLGVYVLVMAGATTAITDATAACSTWPTCNGQFVIPFDDSQLVIAWTHRLLAILVGIIVIGAVTVGWRHTNRTRVRVALGVAAGLYPVQIAVGALTAVNTPTTVLSGLHLVIGMVIFTALLVALTWELEQQSVNSSSGRTPPVKTASVEPSPATPISQSGIVSRIQFTLQAYLRLMKPRLMWLLCLVAAAGMGLAAGPSLTIQTAVLTLVGGVLAIGASGTFNHILERDIDRRMQRTADRPLAMDTIGLRRATVFGIALTIASVSLFLLLNPLAAALGLAAILYYSVIYTLLLKPNTVQNTVVGGLAGAFPALIGAAAATNTIGPAAFVLAGVIFLWTPAHFYNLAMAYRDDYARGGFPMLPVVSGERTTRKHVLWYLGATFLAASVLAAVGKLGPLYSVTSIVFGTVFLIMVIKLHRNPSKTAALRSFHASNAYLGAVLVAVVVDTLVV